MNKSFQKSENRQAEHDPRRKGNKLGEPCHSFSLLHGGVFRSQFGIGTGTPVPLSRGDSVQILGGQTLKLTRGKRSMK